MYFKFSIPRTTFKLFILKYKPQKMEKGKGVNKFSGKPQKKNTSKTKITHRYFVAFSIVYYLYTYYFIYLHNIILYIVCMFIYNTKRITYKQYKVCKLRTLIHHRHFFLRKNIKSL